MKIKIHLFLSLLLFFKCFNSLGQVNPVDVADLTLRIGGLGSTEELYFGFAEGDQIVFTFEETRGRDLNSIEIVELPNSTKFSDFKTSKIDKRIINVNQKGVYMFKFTNNAISGRICNVKIQRIPASEDLVNFNTNWKWETQYDTVYIPYTQDSLVGYDSLRYKETVKELIKTEQKEIMLFDKTERVHSYYNQNSSRTYVKIDLPKNINSTYKTETVTAWAYWIGVGEEANQTFASNVSNYSKTAGALATSFGGPLAGLAVGTITDLMIPTKGEVISYWFVKDFANVQLFLNNQTFYQFDRGKGVAAYGRNTNNTQGTFYICLYNENLRLGLDVNIKVVAVKEVKTYEDKEYDRQKVTPRYVKLNKQRMEVITTQIRVNVDTR